LLKAYQLVKESTSTIKGNSSRWANKAGGPTRQVGKQGRWSNKAGGPTRQVGQQGKRANIASRPGQLMCLL
jgi:hypothetical protein